MRFKMVYALQHQPQRRVDGLELQTSGEGILWRGPDLRFRRYHRHRLPANCREVTSSRMLFSCKTRSTKSLITIVTSYDRRISNDAHLGVAHNNFISAPNEIILGLSSPLQIRLSVADCPCERTFIRLAGLGSLWVASSLPDICRGFSLFVEP